MAEIVEVLEQYGFKNIMRSGDNFMASCIWHKDSKPSFGIHKKTGAWQCMSCKAAGPHLVALVARIEHCSDKEASRKLYGDEESDYYYERLMKRIKMFGAPDPLPEPPEASVIPKDLEVVYWYQDDKAREWMEAKRINPKTADHFGLLYCQAGYYAGHVTVPVHKTDGQLYTFEFRRVIEPGHGKKVLYPFRSKLASVVYNLSHKPPELKRCILVEGCKDVWSVHQVGGYAVSCFGTHLSFKQIKAFIEAGLEQLDVLFDGDEAGERAALEVEEKLSEYMQVVVHHCPQGLDPNDCDPAVLKEIVDGINSGGVMA